MDFNPATERLREALRTVCRRAGRPLAALSRELGRSPLYLSRALRGVHQLKVAELFGLLERVELTPTQFFEVFFPLGGERALTLRREYRQALADLGVDVEPAEPKSLLSSGDRWSAAEWSQATAALLREKIQAADLSQRAVSRALGLPPDRLGLALRGNTRLHVGHVFAVLAHLGIEPGRFFTEVVIGDRGLYGSLRASHALDFLERELARLDTAATRSPRGKGKKPRSGGGKPKTKG